MTVIKKLDKPGGLLSVAGAAASVARESISVSQRSINSNVTTQGKQSAPVSDHDLHLIKSSAVSDITTKTPDSNIELTRSSVTLSVDSLSRPVSSKNKTGKLSIDDLNHEIIMGKAGSVDAFSIKLTFSLRNETGDRSSKIRIFRKLISENNSVRTPNQLMFHHISNVSSRKNKQTVQMFEKMSRRVVERQQDSVTFENTMRQQITSDNKNDLLKTISSTSVNRAAAESLSFFSEKRDLDLSVIRDPASVSSLVKQTISKESSDKAVKSDSGFREIASIDPASFDSSLVAGSSSLTYNDLSVSYGCRYVYYIVPFDSHGIEGKRSKLLQVDVVSITPIKSPDVKLTTDTRSVTVHIVTDNIKVDRFEIYRRNRDIGERKTGNLRVISSLDGFLSKREDRKQLDNGFLQVAEVKSSNFGATFTDRGVIPSCFYEYRVYAVDIFDNKSQEPTTVGALVKGPGRSNSLKKPTILAELQGSTGFIDLTMQIDDDRVVGLFLQRRDISLNEVNFRDPYTEERVQLGTKDVKRTSHISDPVLKSSAANWTSLFQTRKKGVDLVKMTDIYTRFDHTYQYSVYGVDRFGNTTEYAITDSVFVSRDPRIERPVNLSAEKIFISGSLYGVKISWSESNLDIEPLELIGNRADLTDTEVRTLYQLERKGEKGNWEMFNLTDQTAIVDQVSDLRAPSFRPPFLKKNSVYSYRVTALQTGSFISSYSDQIKVNTALPVLAPIDLSLNNVGSVVKLSWNSSKQSGPVEKWDIEKSIVSGTRVDQDVSKLTFKRTISVHNEARRALSRTADSAPVIKKGRTDSDSVFLDKEPLLPGTTSYYRIRSVSSITGEASDWVYRAISKTENKKQLSQSRASSIVEKLR